VPYASFVPKGKRICQNSLLISQSGRRFDAERQIIMEEKRSSIELERRNAFFLLLLLPRTLTDSCGRGSLLKAFSYHIKPSENVSLIWEPSESFLAGNFTLMARLTKRVNARHGNKPVT
jgi:hypothetical protein